MDFTSLSIPERMFFFWVSWSSYYFIESSRSFKFEVIVLKVTSFVSGLLFIVYLVLSLGMALGDVGSAAADIIAACFAASWSANIYSLRSSISLTSNSSLRCIESIRVSLLDTIALTCSSLKSNSSFFFKSYSVISSYMLILSRSSFSSSFSDL